MAANELDARLDTVKKGYDPQQVRQLVSMLSAELKTLDAENEQLREELAFAQRAVVMTPPPPPPPTTPDDIISSWTRETSEMLEGARQHVNRIMEKANADAAAMTTQAETDAAAIRQRAKTDADQLMADARAQAALVAGDGEQRGAAAVQAAEQRSAELLLAAERQAEEAGQHARRSQTSAQAGVDQMAAEAKRLRDEIATLELERAKLREQFVSTQVYLQGLVATIDPPKTVTRDRS